MQDEISYCPAPLGRGTTPYTAQCSGVPLDDGYDVDIVYLDYRKLLIHYLIADSHIN